MSNKVSYVNLLIILGGCFRLADVKAYFNTMYMAREYYKKGDYKKCIENCERIIKYHSKSKYVPEAIYLIAKSSFHLKKYREAEKKYFEFLSLYPDHPLKLKVLIGLSEVKIEKGEFDDAIYYIQKALKEAKGYTKKLIYIRLLNLHFKLKNYEEVLNLGKSYLTCKKNPFRLEIMLLMAKAADSLQNFELALNYKKRIYKKQKSDSLLFSIATDLQNLGENEKAIKYFKKLLKSLKDKKLLPKIHYRMAISYNAMGLTDSAIHHLEISKIPEAYFLLGKIYEQNKKFEEACKYYQKVPKNTKFSKEAILRFSRLKRYLEYRKDTLITAKSTFILGEIFWMEFNQLDSAIYYYSKVLNEFPESEYAPKALFCIAWIYEKYKADTAKALESYTKLCEMFPQTDYAKAARCAIERLEKNENNIK